MQNYKKPMLSVFFRVGFGGLVWTFSTRFVRWVRFVRSQTLNPWFLHFYKSAKNRDFSLFGPKNGSTFWTFSTSPSRVITFMSSRKKGPPIFVLYLLVNFELKIFIFALERKLPGSYSKHHNGALAQRFIWFWWQVVPPCNDLFDLVNK